MADINCKLPGLRITVGCQVQSDTGEGLGYVVGRDPHRADSWFVQFGYYTSQFSLARERLTVVAET